MAAKAPQVNTLRANKLQAKSDLTLLRTGAITLQHLARIAKVYQELEVEELRQKVKRRDHTGI